MCSSNTWCDRHALKTIAFLFTCLCGALVFWSVHLNDGNYVYPLDDTYIGMAMAKNFSQYGVWGITRHQFTSSCSTPLFALILSGCYLITGPNEWWPVVLATAFGVLALWAADRIIRQFLSRTARLFALLGVSVLPPLHVMGIIGMEHSLHIFLVLLFVDYAAQAVQKPHSHGRALFIIAPLMVAARYEGLFLVAVACLLLVRARWRLAVSVSAAAFLPVVVYAVVSVQNGWYWLPNSISMKGASFNRLSIWSLIDHLVYVVRRAPHMPVMFFGLFVIALYVRGKSKYLFAINMITLGSTLAHLCLADVGWVYRYEAYLVALGVIAFSCSWTLVHSRPIILLSALCLFPLVVRSVIASYDAVLCSTAIYQQQFQMGQFVHSYLDGTAIAANDIGALNYYSDLRCLDLTGLANREIFLARRHSQYSTPVIEAEALRLGVKTAMLYEDWFSLQPHVFGGPPVPETWIRVARWRIDSHGRVGSDTVSFYGTDVGAAERLRAAISEYRRRLPSTVHVLP